MKRIEIEVTVEGQVTIEAFGFKGGTCEKATAAIEQGLGKASGPRKRKPEFYQANENRQQAGQGGAA